MNKTIFYFFAAAIILFAWSCQHQPSSQNKNQPENISQETLQTNGTFLISGQILNPTDSLVLLVVGQKTDSLILNPENRFTAHLSITAPGFFALRQGTHSINIFGSPNDSLTVSFDNRDVFNTIHFSGKGSVANEYLKEKYVLMLQQTLPVEQLYNLPVKEFRLLVDSTYVIQKMLLEGYKEQHPEIPDAFVTLEQSALLYDRATTLLEYPVMSPNASKIDPENYFKFLNQLSVNDSSLLGMYEYQSFLKAFINYQANQVMQSRTEDLKPSDKTLIKMQSVARYVQNRAVKNQLLYQLLDEQVKYHGYKNVQTLFQVYEQQCTDSTLRDELLKPYKEYAELASKGPAPEFTMMDRNGKSYSLHDFQGQYLYVDVWATWCLPCRREAPYFEQQREKFKNKNIAFISVSIDQKTGDWLDYLSIKKVEGQQYLIPDAQDFLDAYLIKTIPHFLIIDPNGNLLDADAVRPSENKTEWLQQLPNKQAL